MTLVSLLCRLTCSRSCVATLAVRLSQRGQDILAISHLSTMLKVTDQLLSSRQLARLHERLAHIFLELLPAGMDPSALFADVDCLPSPGILQRPLESLDRRMLHDLISSSSLGSCLLLSFNMFTCPFQELNKSSDVFVPILWSNTGAHGIKPLPHFLNRLHLSACLPVRGGNTHPMP